MHKDLIHQELMDQTNILGENKNVCDRETHCVGEEYIAQVILKNTSCHSLCAFFYHVKYLEKFYQANFKMHLMDQIVMTMMK